jgi:hypothetical protein
MLIEIVLDQEKNDYADYFFECGVWDKDPRYQSRTIKVGKNRGLIRLHKGSGEIELLQPMPEDANEQIFVRAACKIKQHWEAGEIPESTMYACG